MIKNIVLDMGNVLLRYDPEVSLNKFCKDEHEKDIIRKELFGSEDWLLCDMGMFKECEKFDRVSPRVPQENLAALKNCCEHWDICMKPLPGAIEFCRKAKEKGFRLFVLSNVSDIFYELFPREMPMELFDGFVTSAELKVSKPDPRIYRHLLDEFKLNAEECIFFDDMQANVDGAAAVGMNARLFTGDFSTASAELF